MEADTPPALTPTGDAGLPIWVALAGIAAAVAAVAGFAGWFFWQRGLRGLSPASGLYLRLVRLGRMAGVRPPPAATPAEVGASFGEAIPAAREHADRIVQAYELDQYGPGGAGSSLLGAASQAWAALRHHAVGIVVRRRR
jgi:hypothetical protein